MLREVIQSVSTFLPPEHPDEFVRGPVIVIWKDDNGSLFITRHPPEISTEEALETLPGTAIPDSQLYPLWTDDITEAPTPLPPNHFIKVPNPLDYNGTPICAERFAGEVHVLERLRLASVSHPNIVKYYGCVRKGPYIGGICLQRYVCDLAEILREKVPGDTKPPFDPESVICDIEAGLKHIHALGIVHDDINPSNIMLDEDGRAVIIDFNTAGEPGPTESRGTPGWAKGRTRRTFENDEEGFGLVQDAVRNKRSDAPYEIFED
ncbi:hypothetical protein M422DRAFT_171794 [Sphaerobolus stellatus SS14]|uniref:Protein kinase domain-containing protein n=1 Tax=Sphaerobolus stellatus (strain SS14) TaxID=990650 RepID=A0A0C9V4M8_SPHS4|nr:hypothetical protein M422DRAFT_171794 [Sphaerobolus stellatus SS14]